MSQIGQQLSARRGREGDDWRISVERGSEAPFQYGAEPGPKGRHYEWPHSAVVVMLKDHPRPAAPYGAEEGHAVPNLYDGVTRAVSASKFS